jgi:phage-related protein
MKKFISKFLTCSLLIGFFSIPISAKTKSNIDDSLIANVDPYNLPKISINKKLGKITVDSNEKYLSIPNNSNEYVKLKTNSNKLLWNGNSCRFRFKCYC